MQTCTYTCMHTEARTPQKRALLSSHLFGSCFRCVCALHTPCIRPTYTVCAYIHTQVHESIYTHAHMHTEARACVCVCLCDTIVYKRSITHAQQCPVCLCLCVCVCVCVCVTHRHNPEPFHRLAKELYPGTVKPTLTHYFLALLHRKGLLQRCFT